MHEISVGSNDSGQRLDKFLKKYLSRASAGFIYSGIRKGNIKLNGRRARPHVLLKSGDTLQLFFNLSDVTGERMQGTVPKAGMDFAVAYEDKNIIIGDKPPGLLSHPDGSKAETLTGQILYYLYKKKEYDPRKEKTFSPAICNRLDRNTGGLVIAAKNFKALQDINKMIRERWIARYYRLIVKGHVKEAMKVSAYLVKDNRTNRVEVSGKPMIGSSRIETFIEPLEYGEGGYTLIEVKLGTGRTHQIRAHLAHLGFPVLGDKKYGDSKAKDLLRGKFGLKHQFLYAHRLVFERVTPFFGYLEGETVEVSLPTELRLIKERIF